jgi:hypothetical protein
LNDFRTKDNTLSVWLIDNDKSNLDRVAAAFATTRKKLDLVEFVLLPDNLLPPDIQVKKEDGETFDGMANKDWHRDLVQLTGQRIVALAKQFYHEGYKKQEIGRYEHTRIAALIKDGIQRIEIDPQKLNSKLREDIGLVT